MKATDLPPFVLYDAFLSGLSLGFRETQDGTSSARGAIVGLQSGVIRWTDEAGDHSVSGPVMLIWDMARVVRASYETAQLRYLAFDPAALGNSAWAILALHAARVDGEMKVFADGVLGAVSRHAASESGDESSAEIIASLLGLLARKHAGAARQNGPVLLVDKVKALVEQDPSAPWTAGALGRVLGLSRASLYRKLELLGGVAELVLTTKVAGAKRVLVGNPDTPLKDIAAAFGLGGRRRLDAAFEAVTGETASSLQERLRESAVNHDFAASLEWEELLNWRGIKRGGGRLTD
jgi:AraC-like DNA-binding protein